MEFKFENHENPNPHVCTCMCLCVCVWGGGVYTYLPILNSISLLNFMFLTSSLTYFQRSWGPSSQ